MIEAGLCGLCRNAQRNETRRGPVYLRCLLAAEDPRFLKYPRLPVLTCPGYEADSVPPDAGSDEE